MVGVYGSTVQLKTQKLKHRTTETRKHRFSVFTLSLLAYNIYMRLAADDVQAIREEIRRRDPMAEIYLFGSRTDDLSRGGDIDLLVVSDVLTFRDVLHVRSGILDRIGWQQLDLLVRHRDELDEPLAAAALQSGLKL
jgi:uncharacterized protein